MDVQAEMRIIGHRIAQITGGPVPGMPEESPQDFNAALAAALSAQNTPVSKWGGQQGAAGAAGADGQVSQLAPAPVPPAQIDALVSQNAATWQVDPALIKAVIANESGFNAHATSNVGAQGLMQLMPDTAAGLGVQNAYDPAQNVAGGTRYLKSLLDRFGGDTRKAVAAYNAGPGAVEKYNDVPPYAETRNYVQNVLGSYQKYQAETK